MVKHTRAHSGVCRPRKEPSGYRASILHTPKQSGDNGTRRGTVRSRLVRIRRTLFSGRETPKPPGPHSTKAIPMSKRTHRELITLVRQAADLASEAHFDGLDPRTAVFAAAMQVAFPQSMSRRDIADWLRRLANEFEAY
jgi:hypothetical protein